MHQIVYEYRLSTQSGNDPFWRTFHHGWKNQPRLVRLVGGRTPSPFHYTYHHVQSCGVCSSWEGRHTPPISTLPLYTYVLCGWEIKLSLYCGWVTEYEICNLADFWMLNHGSAHLHHRVHLEMKYRECICPTGRQPPPLSSVLYRIISERRYVLAAQAQLLLREKSGA